MEPVRLRPLGIGEILDAAIKVYSARVVPLMKAVAVVVVPVQALTVVVQLSLPTDAFATTNELGETTIDTAALIGAGAALVATAALGWLASTFATAASMRLISEAYLGQERSWTESLAFALRRLGSLVWVAFLIAVVGGLALLLCLVPGIYLFVAWAVAVPVLLVEDVRGWGALRRSRSLVKGSWWRVAGCLAVAFILSSVVAAVLQGVLTAVVLGTDDTTVQTLTSGVATVVSSVLVTPFAAAVAAIVYFDLRVRKEGFDLELLARSVGVDPPAQGTAGAPSPSA